MLLQESINAAVQLFIVLTVAVIVWAISGRKKAGFFHWVGLIRPTPESMGTAFLIFIGWSLVSSAVFLWPEFRNAAKADNTVAGMLKEQGFSLEIIGVILVVAGIKTALTEEIFFRGLIAKRMINGLGFGIGNTLHAGIFGGIHLLIFAVPGGPPFSLPLAAAFLLLPGVAGWLMAYANEKAGNGSLAPGWLIHALGNAVSYPLLAFVL